MNALVREGYRQARAVCAERAKSFFFASAALFGARRRAAYALYAACRRLDDLVDGGGQVDPEGLRAAQASIASLYVRHPGLAARPSPAPVAAAHRAAFTDAELAALEHTIATFRIPEQPFQDLVLGMEMDLTQARYATYAELDLYCYRVAGVVGLMMAPVLGCRDERALSAAADLGRAMQLTNILRDVKEDWERGRVYLPQDELAAFELTDADLARGVVDDRWRAFARCQIARARAYYRRGAAGVGALGGFGARRTVKLMGAIYGGILEEIERADHDVFSRRAHVPLARKLRIGARVLLRPSTVLPASFPLASKEVTA